MEASNDKTEAGAGAVAGGGSLRETSAAMAGGGDPPRPERVKLHLGQLHGADSRSESERLLQARLRFYASKNRFTRDAIFGDFDEYLIIEAGGTAMTVGGDPVSVERILSHLRQLYGAEIRFSRIRDPSRIPMDEKELELDSNRPEDGYIMPEILIAEGGDPPCPERVCLAQLLGTDSQSERLRKRLRSYTISNFWRSMVDATEVELGKYIVPQWIYEDFITKINNDQGSNPEGGGGHPATPYPSKFIDDLEYGSTTNRRMCDRRMFGDFDRAIEDFITKINNDQGSNPEGGGGHPATPYPSKSRDKMPGISNGASSDGGIELMRNFQGPPVMRNRLARLLLSAARGGGSDTAYLLPLHNSPGRPEPERILDIYTITLAALLIGAASASFQAISAFEKPLGSKLKLLLYGGCCLPVVLLAAGTTATLVFDKSPKPKVFTHYALLLFVVSIAALAIFGFCSLFFH